MANDNAKNFVQTILSMIKNELKSTPELIPASVIRKNVDGTYNVSVPGTTEEIRVTNQTPFELESGDVVALFLKTRGKLNDSFIIEAKGKSNNTSPTGEVNNIINNYYDVDVPTKSETYTISGVDGSKYMQPSKWSSNVYSYEDFYPSSVYDITVELNGSTCTTAQMEAWAKAKLVGDPTENKCYAKGTIPSSVQIPVIIKWVKKEVTVDGLIDSE